MATPIGDWEAFFYGWTVIKTVMIQQRFLNEILRHTTANDMLLEIGSGSGLTSLALYFSGRPNLAVTDHRSVALARLKRFFPMRVSYVDMFNIELPKASVDCIFHQGLMEHFDDDAIVAGLWQQARVAKKIIFDVPNDRRWKKVGEYGDERFLSVAHWTGLIERAGLRVVKVTGRRLPWGFDFLPHGWQNVEWVNRTFGTTSIFVCETK